MRLWQHDKVRCQPLRLLCSPLPSPSTTAPSTVCLLPLRDKTDQKRRAPPTNPHRHTNTTRYTSRVTLQRPHRVSSTVVNSGLFHHLESSWAMAPGPAPNTTWLSFSVDFAFLNPLYANVAALFFSEVVQRMMGAFEGRCRALYGAPSFVAAPSRHHRGAAAAPAAAVSSAPHVQQHQAVQQGEQRGPGAPPAAAASASLTARAAAAGAAAAAAAAAARHNGQVFTAVQAGQAAERSRS